MTNARNATKYALAKLPEVDSGRLYAVGHSSAGKQAFLLAVHDARIKACVSFNGVLDVEADLVGRVGEEFLEYLPEGSREFILATSPRIYESKLACPLFLFHTTDDEVLPLEHSSGAASRLKRLGKEVEFVTLPGDHYEPMLDEGIPLAIKWLKKVDQRQVQ